MSANESLPPRIAELEELRRRLSTVYVKPCAAQEYYILCRDGEFLVFDSPELFQNVAFGLPLGSAATADKDGWITFGRVKVDIENETETFERIHPPKDSAAVPPDGNATTGEYACNNAKCGWRSSGSSRPLSRVLKVGCPLCDGEARFIGLKAADSMDLDEDAKRWAWDQCRKDVGANGWTVGEHGNYFGFFTWGWWYRAQLEKQRREAVSPDTEAQAREIIGIVESCECSRTCNLCRDEIAKILQSRSNSRYEEGVRAAIKKAQERKQFYSDRGYADAASVAVEICGSLERLALSPETTKGSDETE